MDTRIALPILLALFAGSAQAQDYTFEWQGGGGYHLRGAVSFNPQYGKGLLTEEDVACFEITGYHQGQSIGRWALGALTDDTTWILTFDPGQPAFLTPGYQSSMPQAWNMTGYGDGCGEGGFGFNLGSAFQDICINDQLIIESQIDPNTPFPATPVSGYLFREDACEATTITSSGKD